MHREVDEVRRRGQARAWRRSPLIDASNHMAAHTKWQHLGRLIRRDDADETISMHFGDIVQSLRLRLLDPSPEVICPLVRAGGTAGEMQCPADCSLHF